MNTLCVIDMQTGFWPSVKKVVPHCVDLINQAIEKNEHIIVVEYVDHGWAPKPILEALKGYNNVHYCFKKCDGGAHIVYGTLIKKGIIPDKIKVCGVNTHQCVKDTVIGMAEHFYDTEFEVVAKACNSTTDVNHRYGLKTMIASNTRIKIV